MDDSSRAFVIMSTIVSPGHTRCNQQALQMARSTLVTSLTAWDCVCMCSHTSCTVLLTLWGQEPVYTFTLWGQFHFHGHKMSRSLNFCVMTKVSDERDE